MAGSGTRFAEQGYENIKPLIDVNGVPMIKQVIDSLGLVGNYIFIIQEQHALTTEIVDVLRELVPEHTLIEIGGLTEGAALTCLAAKDYIDNDTPLLIANSDQVIVWDASAFTSLLASQDAIALFKADDPKWSYAEINDGNIVRVAEKEVISNDASVGIYGWQKGSDYIKYAEQMVAKDIRVNDEFYICPVYNEAIQDGHIVAPYFVDEMYGIGTPEDLEAYLAKNSTQG